MKYFIFLFLISFLVKVNSNSLKSTFNLASATQTAANSKTNMIENCNNPCLSCQNTLYFLKFRGNAECRFNRCPGLCMSLSGQWHSNRNSHMNMFRENQINICETCFRSNHCHINDCILEKTIVHNAIQHATEKFNFHYLNPNSGVFNIVNKKSEDYFFNMDFIFKNTDKTLGLLKQYEKVYADSIKLKKFYKIILKFLSNKVQLNLSEVNLGLQIDIDADLLPQWSDMQEHLRIYKNYYMALKSDKIHLNEEKIYLSTDIKKEEDVVKNIIDFDNKVKLNLNKAHNVTEVYKMKCHENLETLKKLVMFVDVVASSNIDNQKKMEILTAKESPTPEQLKELLKSKPKEKVKLSNSKNSAVSIKVAGKKIKIKQDGGNKVNNNISSSPVQLPELNPKGKVNDEIVDEAELYDESEEKLLDKLEEKPKKVKEDKTNKIKEPSLGGKDGSFTESTKLNDKVENKSNKKGEMTNLDKNFDKIAEPSINGNSKNKTNSIVLDKSTYLNKLSEKSKSPIIEIIKSESKSNNISIKDDKDSQPPVTGNNLVIHASPRTPAPLPIPPIASAPIPTPIPNAPSAEPVMPKITAVKVTSPNDTYNKNVFKPDAKIDTLSKMILGIDPKPKDPKASPPIISPSTVHQLENIKKMIKSTQVTEKETNRDSKLENKIDEKLSSLNPSAPSISQSRNITTPSETPNSVTPSQSDIKNINRSNPSARKQSETEDSDEDSIGDDDPFGEDDEKDNLLDDKKAFIQKKSRKRSDYEPSDNLDIDLSILKTNKNIFKNNKIKKLSVDEIKKSGKRFMAELKNHLSEFKNSISNEDEKSKSDDIGDNVSFIQEDNRSLANISRNSNNIVNLLSNNLDTLDEQFFEIKHKIIMNLIK